MALKSAEISGILFQALKTGEINAFHDFNQSMQVVTDKLVQENLSLFNH